MLRYVKLFATGQEGHEDGRSQLLCAETGWFSTVLMSLPLPES